VSIVAFRRWLVDVDGLLRPLHIGTRLAWPPDAPTRAQCCCGAAHGQQHDRPEFGAAGDSCGLYTYKEPIAACRCDEPSAERHGVAGVVRIWGRVVEHSRGWRSEFGQPVAVVDFAGRLSSQYDIPRYPGLESMYAEWAPDLAATSVEDARWCNPARFKALGQVVHSTMPNFGVMLAGASAAFARLAGQVGTATEVCAQCDQPGHSILCCTPKQPKSWIDDITYGPRLLASLSTDYTTEVVCSTCKQPWAGSKLKLQIV
jgi:hypothetical protein